MIRKYRRRTVDVLAIQNDGTDQRAMAIAAWVRAGGGMATAMPIGTVDEDPSHAYVHVVNDRAQKIAAPDFWVIKTPANKFHVVNDKDFHYLYYGLDDIPDEPTA